MIDFAQLESVIRRDPGGRGLASYRDVEGRPLLAGQLERTVRGLKQAHARVLIVTGFAIITDDGVRAETDGPPGAIHLAAMLQACGCEVSFAADRYASPLLRAGLSDAGIIAEMIEFPIDSSREVAEERVTSWSQEFVTSERFSAVVSIEHVGPSHTAESVTAEERAEFESLVPPEHRNVCHNMRGVNIDEVTAPLHLIFEPYRNAFVFGPPPPVTIGIIDGGNEIGSGAIPWSTLRSAIAQGPGAITACRIPTKATIISGVSNWGAYALGAAVAASCGQRAAVETWTSEKQRRLIEAIVRDGGAVDGVTKRREATVDGLPLDEYLDVFEDVRRICLAG